MVPRDLKPEGYEIRVISNPMKGGASRYLRIKAVGGNDFQICILKYSYS